MNHARGIRVAEVPLEGDNLCLGMHPSLPRVASGDHAGRIAIHDLMGLPSGPPIVTALGEERPQVRCPRCDSVSHTTRDRLGLTFSCPEIDCGQPIRLNRFWVEVAEG